MKTAKKVLIIVLSVLLAIAIADTIVVIVYARKPKVPDSGEHVHVYDQKVEKSEYLVKSATCEKEAEYYFSCTCGESAGAKVTDGKLPVGGYPTFYGTSAESKRLGHDLVTHEAKSATCTEDGYKEYVTCKRCDYSTLEKSIITAYGHLYGKTTYEWSDDNATCTAKHVCTRDGCDGSEEELKFSTKSITQPQTCTNAEVTTYSATFDNKAFGTKRVSVQTKTAKGHEFADEWTMTKTEHYHASTCGHPSVKKDADAHNFTGGICGVCGYSQYFELKKNNGDNGYTLTGFSEDCPENVVIPSIYQGLPITAVGDRAFRLNENIKTLVVSEGITELGEQAFSFCSALTSVTLPESLTTLGNYAFYGTALSEIILPERLTVIGNYAFYGCESLANVKIGSNVTTIGTSAFNGCTSLTKISIPENVNEIGENAFNGCTGLTEIIVGTGELAVGIQSFNGCDNLTAVYYLGTQADWERDVTIDARGNAPLMQATKYYFSETEPEKTEDGTAYTGNYWHYGGADGITPTPWIIQKTDETKEAV